MLLTSTELLQLLDITDQNRLEEANIKRQQFGNTSRHNTRFRQDVDTVPRRTTRVLLAPQLSFAPPRSHGTEDKVIRDRRELQITQTDPGNSTIIHVVTIGQY